MTRRIATIAAAASLTIGLGGCGSTTSGSPQTPPGGTTPPSRTASTSVSAPATHPSVPASTTTKPAVSTARAVWSAMSETQRVGQLFMVDCPSTQVSEATLNAIETHYVGSVILDGTSQLSVDATAAITATLQRDAPGRARLFIATDQEGGLVQRLRGPGFSTVPSALDQGGIAPTTLRAEAADWASQLRRAGVNVDLAPVLDTVPSGWGSNPPIGDLDREYGHTPATVSSHGVAVARGLADGGVDATVKHFPGLGRTRGNTDVATGVADTVTVRNDPYLAPFAAAVAAGVPFVMMSTAIYTKIDPSRPAAFSSTIVTGMLRGDLGFSGIVISDDLGAAKQVSGYSIGGRAVAFVQAGGDIVLTVDASQATVMTAAVLARTRTDTNFKALVDAAALRVLQAKQARGLLG
ncbi:MAG TPA: glycoside hydrolase family 3 N-terminal domain-containing protein [Jatrophihabitantaceae bacterium]|jgi:beta-N-acetylhexosaminidase|nr:glycoside hydrolase family 3 N-terminal domain-containing protein [Jatrophihabitantaceae bacterium]